MSETTTISVPSARLDQLADRLTEVKGIVQAIALLPEPHLALVCVQIRHGEFVTWKVNLQVCLEFPDCGCGNGHYFTQHNAAGNADRDHNLANAMRDFRERYTEAWALLIDTI